MPLKECWPHRKDGRCGCSSGRSCDRGHAHSAFPILVAASSASLLVTCAVALSDRERGCPGSLARPGCQRPVRGAARCWVHMRRAGQSPGDGKCASMGGLAKVRLAASIVAARYDRPLIVPTMTTTVGRAPAASEIRDPSVPATIVLTRFTNIVVLPRMWLTTG